MILDFYGFVALVFVADGSSDDRPEGPSSPADPKRQAR